MSATRWVDVVVPVPVRTAFTYAWSLDREPEPGAETGDALERLAHGHHGGDQPAHGLHPARRHHPALWAEPSAARGGGYRVRRRARIQRQRSAPLRRRAPQLSAPAARFVVLDGRVLPLCARRGHGGLDARIHAGRARRRVYLHPARRRGVVTAVCGASPRFRGRERRCRAPSSRPKPCRATFSWP